eukprot:gene8614-17922_t
MGRSIREVHNADQRLLDAVGPNLCLGKLGLLSNLEALLEAGPQLTLQFWAYFKFYRRAAGGGSTTLMISMITSVTILIG